MFKGNHLCGAVLAVFVIALSGPVEAGELELGQCRYHDTKSGLPEYVEAVTTGYYVDVTTDPIVVPARSEGHMSTEITILKDFDFDVLGINHVTAIQQIYKVDCTCGDLSLNPRPWECTNGVTDVLLHAYEAKSNFNEKTRLWPVVFGDSVMEEPSFISIVMHPADSGFAYRAASGPLKKASLKLGANGGSRLTVGTLAARIILSDEPRTIAPITMRFHVLGKPPRPSDLNTAFLVGVNFMDQRSPSFLTISEGLQVRSERISETNVRHLIKVVNETGNIRFLHLGVVGHHWLTSTRLEVKREDGKIETIDVNDQFNFYGSSLPVSDLVLRKGDEIQFTCEYENTANPIIDSLLGESPVIPVGPFMGHAPCAIQAVYGQAKCDSQFLSTPFQTGGEIQGFDCKP